MRSKITIIIRCFGPEYCALGCYLDKLSPRQLEKLAYAGRQDNTPERCEDSCRGYLYFGLQSGEECFCGNTLAHQEKRAESDCHLRCSGDHSKICGGPWRNSLFKIKLHQQQRKIFVFTTCVGGWSSEGSSCCWSWDFLLLGPVHLQRGF